MNFGSLLKYNAPKILTAVAIIGTPVSSYLTGRAVLKAEKILRDIPEGEWKSHKKELILAYLPPVISNLVTMGSSAGCYLFNKKLQAGYLAAFSLLNTTFTAYQAKTELEFDDAGLEISDKVITDRVNAEIEKVMASMPGEEYELWIDDYRKHPYWARKSDILLGKDDLNRNLTDPNFSRNFGLAGLEVFYSHVVGDSEPQDSLWGWNLDQLEEECGTDTVGIDWYENGVYTDPNTGIKIRCNYIWWDWPPILNYWNYESSWNK